MISRRFITQLFRIAPVKEHLTVLEVDSFEQLVDQYQSFFPSALNSEKEEIDVKDTSALIHTFASTRALFEQLMVQLGTETQHETLVKILELANVALARESEPVQLELESEKVTEIAQLKEILITKDKEINRLSKAIAASEAQVSHFQAQLTEEKATIAQQETALQQAQQAYTELLSQTDQLQDEVKRLHDLLHEKEQMIVTLQTDLANSQQLITELQTTQTPEPTEPLSESAQLTKAMITLTGVISKLSLALTTNEKTEQATQSINKSNTVLSKANVTSHSSTTTSTKSSPKRSRSGKEERISQAIALVMQHNLNSPLEQRWLISYPVLADLVGISLTPITAFFNDEKNQQLVMAITQHHQDLGLTNNTHNRTYHPKQKITQFLKMPN